MTLELARGQVWQNRRSRLNWTVTELLDDKGRTVVRLSRDGSVAEPVVSLSWLRQAYRFVGVSGDR